MSKLHYCVVKYSCTNTRIKCWKVKSVCSEFFSLCWSQDLNGSVSPALHLGGRCSWRERLRLGFAAGCWAWPTFSSWQKDGPQMPVSAHGAPRSGILNGPLASYLWLVPSSFWFFFLCVCFFKNCLHSLYFSLRALGWTLNERSEFWPFWHQCVGSFLLWVLESLLILWSKKAHLASWLHKQFLSLGGPRTVWGASASTLAFLTLGAFGGYLLSVR